MRDTRVTVNTPDSPPPAQETDHVDVAVTGYALWPASVRARFHAREDGQILSGAAAFAAMWRAIPVLRPLGLVARNRHILAMLEHAYRLFLRVRPRLQRLALGWDRR